MSRPAMSSRDTPGGLITCWLLDTRVLWQGDKIETAAPEALRLVSPAERETCMRKMFIEDARMSLGSALLKRLFVSQTLGLLWDKVTFARRDNPKHGKPCALLPDGSAAPIDFNVSHQAGLVSLIGWKPSSTRKSVGEPDLVGTDIVCVNERDDYRTIDAEGFDGWVDIYEEIFSEDERWDMKYKIDSITLLDGQNIDSAALARDDRCVRRDQELSLTLPSGQQQTFSSDILIDAKLRRFYTFFCYKEAYIKLAGEALLAPWLKQLEFSNVRSPRAGTVARCSTHGTWGEKVEDVEVHLHGKPVGNVKMAIQAFEENFLISTAVQGELGVEVPPFMKLHLENDILAHATKV